METLLFSLKVAVYAPDAVSFLGSRDGAVVRALVSHQCGPGSIPASVVIFALSLLLVLVLPPKGFNPGIPVFPSPQKPTFPNSKAIRIIVKHFTIPPLARGIVQALPVLLTSNKLLYFTFIEYKAEQ